MRSSIVKSPSPIELLGAALAALYAAALAYTLVSGSLVLLPALVLVPGLAGVAVLLSRRALPRPAATALAWCGLLAVAVAAAIAVVLEPLLAPALPALLVAGIVARRHPVAVTVATFALTGTYGTLTAYGDLPSGPAVDLGLAGLWLAALHGWFVRGARRPTPLLTAGVLVLALYVAVSAAQIVGAESLTVGLHWFRASIWYLAGGLLVAYAPWGPGARAQAARGVLVVALAVGAYAALRSFTDPTGAERTLAEQNPNNELDGTLRPIGSFTSTKELAAWCAIVLPFCFAAAITMRGRWRVIAALAGGALVVGMLGTDVRAAVAAAIPGAVVVLVLLQVARAFTSAHKAAALVIATIAALGAGTAAYAVTLGTKDSSAERYRALTRPRADPSVKAREYKWTEALGDVRHAPLGHGPGTAGRTASRFGRYRTVGSIDIDNAYVTIAYQQGMAIMALFAAGLLLLVVALARAAAVLRSPPRAAVAIGACGTLVSMGVLFFAGDYVEGLPALAGWLIVGLGLGGAVMRSDPA